MGYSTTALVDSILAQALTSATNSVVNGNKVPLVGFGNSRDPNTIPDALVNQYIQWADEEVDGMLSEMYQTPLLEKADLEMRLLYDVSEYNSAVELDKAYNLVPGDVLCSSMRHRKSDTLLTLLLITRMLSLLTR